MQRFWLPAVLAGAGLLAAGSAAARPCDAAAIAGTWRLATINADEPGVEAFYASMGDEWMRFGPGDTFIHVASRNGGGAPAVIQSRLDAADAADGVTYRTAVDAAGVLAIARAGRFWQAFQCRIADRAEADVAVGDMILTNLPGAPAVRRVQRRVVPGT